MSAAAIALRPLQGHTITVEPGRFSARPRKATKDVGPGEHVLFEENGRRSVLYVPPGYDAKRAAPFALALHGATGSGDSMLRGSRAAADAHGVILLSPSSTGNTWDALHRGYVRDVPGALEAHDRQHCPAYAERAEEVHVDLPLGFLGGREFQGPRDVETPLALEDDIDAALN